MDINIGDLVTLYNHKTCKYDTYPVKEIYICESSDIKEHEGKRMYVLHTGEATECLYVSEYVLYGVVKCLK